MIWNQITWSSSTTVANNFNLTQWSTGTIKSSLWQFLFFG